MASYAFATFWPKIYLVDEEEETMHNLGLVAPDPNPFVFTGLPKVGQVWKYKYSDRPYLQILKVDCYWYRVTYRCLCGQDNCGQATTVPIPELQDKFVFSH